jgi:hypothetical protein
LFSGLESIAKSPIASFIDRVTSGSNLNTIPTLFYFVAVVRAGNAYHGARALAPQSGLPA